MNAFKLPALKIEALRTAMKYGTRDDFAARRQDIIDAVRRTITQVLRDADKPGNVEVSKDDDGDLSFYFERSSFHFMLEARANLSGATFKDLYQHSLAFEILKTFHTQIVQVLGLSDIDVLTVDFSNVFNLAKDSDKNYLLLQRQLMPPLRDQLEPLLPSNGEIARLDFKVGWDYDERRTCYYSVECPANDENTTVWATLNIRTRDDILVHVDPAEISSDLKKSYDIYCGPYATVLDKLFIDTNLDYQRRQLIS